MTKSDEIEGDMANFVLLSKAKGLVEETGYHRRDGEVAQLEEALVEF